MIYSGNINGRTMTELEILIDTHARCQDDACRAIKAYEKASQTFTSPTHVPQAALAFTKGARTVLGAACLHDM